MPPKKEAAAEPEAMPARPEEMPAALAEERELVERELAIGHLSSRLARYQLAGRDLAATRRELAAELDGAIAKSAEINLHLSSDLRAKEAQIDELRLRVARLAAELDALGGESERRMEALSADGLRARAEAKAEIDARLAEIAELDAFDLTREALATELEEKEALRAKQREAHAAKSRELERVAAAEKDEMRRDLEAKIASTKANMKATTDAQLDATAKRTILENEQMGSELVYQARETGRLLDRNDALAAEHAAAVAATRASRATERELAATNHVLAKTVRALQERIAREEALDAAERKRRAEAPGPGPAETARLSSRLRETRAAAAELARRTDEAAAERDEAAAEIKMRGGGEAAREEVLAFLGRCAADAEAEGSSGGDARRRELFALRSALGGEGGRGRVDDLGALLGVLFPDGKG